MIHEIASRMPVTTDLAIQVGEGKLCGLLIIHINHLLNDILDLNEILTWLGAKVVFIPISYSGEKHLPNVAYTIINPRIDQTTKRGVLSAETDVSLRASSTFAGSVRGAIAGALDMISSKGFLTGENRLMIIDDGGYHFDLLDDLRVLDGKLLYIGSVEQTVAGIRMARRRLSTNTEMHHPVLSAARSKLKMRFENYFVARRVIEELSLLLYELDEFLSFRDVLMCGYGIIGRAIAHTLRGQNCNVMVLDTDTIISHTAMCEGFDTIDSIDPDIFETMPIVLGATGFPSFTLKHFVSYLKSSASILYLASASSKRVEFSMVIDYLEGENSYRQSLYRTYPELAEIERLTVTRTTWGLEYSFEHKGKKRGVRLLAAGYPVNFFRSASESLPARVVDVTNAEILALSCYLFQHYRELEGEVYLLGQASIPNLHLEESSILTAWLSRNWISSKFSNPGMWHIFSPHPCEHLLASM